MSNVHIDVIYTYRKAQRLINQKWIIRSLQLVGDVMLKSEYRSKWSVDNPTYGYCYLVSELLYHYVYPNSKSYTIDLSSVGEDTHWFLKNNGKIIDYTGIQFQYITPNKNNEGRFFDFENGDYTFKVPYPKARRTAFFDGKYRTTRGLISERSVQLGEKFGLLKVNHLK
jgi:hypothetical protein